MADKLLDRLRDKIYRAKKKGDQEEVDRLTARRENYKNSTQYKNRRKKSRKQKIDDKIDQDNKEMAPKRRKSTPYAMVRQSGSLTNSMTQTQIARQKDREQVNTIERKLNPDGSIEEKEVQKISERTQEVENSVKYERSRIQAIEAKMKSLKAEQQSPAVRRILAMEKRQRVRPMKNLPKTGFYKYLDAKPYNFEDLYLADFKKLKADIDAKYPLPKVTDDHPLFALERRWRNIGKQYPHLKVPFEKTLATIKSKIAEIALRGKPKDLEILEKMWRSYAPKNGPAYLGFYEKRSFNLGNRSLPLRSAFDVVIGFENDEFEPEILPYIRHIYGFYQCLTNPNFLEGCYVHVTGRRAQYSSSIPIGRFEMVFGIKSQALRWLFPFDDSFESFNSTVGREWVMLQVGTPDRSDECYVWIPTRWMSEVQPENAFLEDLRDESEAWFDNLRKLPTPGTAEPMYQIPGTDIILPRPVACLPSFSWVLPSIERARLAQDRQLQADRMSQRLKDMEEFEAMTEEQQYKAQTDKQRSFREQQNALYDAAMANDDF